MQELFKISMNIISKLQVVDMYTYICTDNIYTYT